jgi:hypothetical protein
MSTETDITSTIIQDSNISTVYIYNNFYNNNNNNDEIIRGGNNLLNRRVCSLSIARHILIERIDYLPEVQLCPICLDQKKVKPYMFQCSHNVCLSCLYQMIDMKCCECRSNLTPISELEQHITRS